MLLRTMKETQAAYGERWNELCDQALKEDDPSRLSELIREINQVIEQKQRAFNKSVFGMPNFHLVPALGAQTKHSDSHLAQPSKRAVENAGLVGD
jgi:hypothetical protein